MKKAQEECNKYAPDGGAGDGKPIPKEDQDAPK